MLKLYFYAVTDSLTESVISVFYARSMSHAKQIVKNGLKNKVDDDMIEHLQLVQISDLIEVPNDYEKIFDGYLGNSRYLACPVKILFDGEKGVNNE